MITKQFSIIFSSDPLSGASNISTSDVNAGSIFTTTLNNPISIPKEAKSAELMVSRANVWWTILNVVKGVNDTFVFRFTAQSPFYNAGNVYPVITCHRGYIACLPLLMP